MECLLVSHTHWDREWYRTFQLFRARLVDTVDRVLDLVAADPGYRFLLDGQSVVLEDYLEIRPHRRDELVAACTEGRLAVGPWYVQPDSILPSGEAHVRNLLEGRRVAEQVAPRASRVAYTPDSFGHPAQFPQLFAGFGMDAFVYWRGNGDELDDLAPVWRWVAPDGTSLAAVHLGGGYFSAAHLPSDVALAAKKLEAVGAELGPAAGGRVLLMNGSDHLLPDAHVDEVAAALEASTGWVVRRGLLEDFIATLPPEEDQPRWTGDLLGGRLANLLPGVWSTRTWLKVRNRRAESLLTAEAEPWAALGGALGAGDEQPALRLAWRSLLQNQAHDSICGCSVDAVHRQMTPRYEAASELAVETTARLLDRLAGLGPERRVPWSDSFDLAVFNPSPWPRTDVVRFPLEGFPLYGIKSDGTADVHPIALASLLHRGYEVGGRPARLVAVDDPDRVRMVPEQVPTDVEVVVADVPAFGWRRLSLEPAPEVADEVDDGRRIEVAGADDEPVVVEVAADGTLAVTLGQRSWSGLAGLEDLGDRGDSYDADLMDDGEVEVASVEVVRRRHPSGLQSLVVTRRLRVPAGLIEDRSSRSDEAVELPVVVEARLVPGVGRVDLRVAVDNRAEDHRLRLVFPTGAAVAASRSATTFGVARRPVGAPDASRWVHAAHSTFPNQGWVAAGGLLVAAPGLVESEVTADGAIVLTLLRSVGWLSRMDLRSRPDPAGPGLATPEAQCPGRFETRLALLAEADAWAAPAAEVGLRAVPAGGEPLVAEGRPLLSLEPREVVLSALKPAEDGDGIVVRVLNPTDEELTAVLTVGFGVTEAVTVRLDEEPADEHVALEPSPAGARLTIEVPPAALRSVRLRT